MKHLKEIVLFLAIVGLLLACGGGGGSSSSTDDAEVVAFAGLDLSKPDVDDGDFIFIHVDTVMADGNYLVTTSTNLDIQYSTDENIYMTNIIVLKHVQAAGNTFTMGSSESPDIFALDNETRHDVTFSSNFYMGVYEVTQRQWLHVMGGDNPSEWRADNNPVESISYDTIRGDATIYDWPATDTADGSSFIGLLRERTGLDLDLPTEAEWEYTCKAGTETPNFSGNNTMGNTTELSEDLEDIAFFLDNNPGIFDVKQTTGVGGLNPNAWGFYDMLGNVFEWCNDNYEIDLGTASQTDPVGSTTNGAKTLRGGAYGNSAVNVRSASRSAAVTTNELETYGLRLYLKEE